MVGTTLSQRSLTLLLFGVATACAVGTATDPDLFWHLRTGEMILHDGVPTGDVFSYTVPGKEWIAHEWGSQVIMWMIWSLAGSTALILAFTALTTGVYVLAARTSLARPIPTGFIVVLAAMTARISTSPRPQLFNLLGLATVVFLFERLRARRLDPRWAWAIVPIILVWANLHSGYLMGVATVAVYAVGERFEARRGGKPLPAEVVRWLPLLAIAGFAVAAVNPSGTAMWTYPLDTLRSSAMREHIREWESPDFHLVAFWPFLVLLAVAVTTVVASRVRPNRTHALLLLGTGLASLQSMRHIPLFAVLAIPFVAPHLQDTIDQLRAERSRVGSQLARSQPVMALTATLAIMIAALFVSAAVNNNDRAVAEIFPVDAVNVILDSDLADARGFNSYGWGGYLIWRDIPVFIDGRADVYGDEFMERYFGARDSGTDWRELFDEYDVAYVLLEPGAELNPVLVEAAEWVLVYADGVAELFVRCPDDIECHDPEVVASHLGLTNTPS
jgi:hypothetical protein